MPAEGQGDPVSRTGAPTNNQAAWMVVAGLLGMGFVLLGVLFLDTSLAFVRVWYHSASFNHGFLILPICLWLVWLRRDALLATHPRPSMWGMAALVPAILLWLVGEVAGVVQVQQFAVVFMYQALVVATIGLKASRAIAFPLFYLLFAVPFGEAIIPPLQDMLAVFIASGLEFIGIPVFLEGYFLYLPSGVFEVAEACAGLRYLIAAVAFGALYANLTYRQAWRRWLFMLLCVLVSIFANWVRGFVIVVMIYWSDYKIAVGIDHMIFGWVWFGVLIAALIGIGMLFREPGAAPIGQVDNAVTVPRHHSPNWHYAAPNAVALFGAALALLGSSVIAERAENATLDLRLAPPAILADWRLAEVPDDGWRLHYPGATGTTGWAYRSGENWVRLRIAYFASQSQGREVVAYENRPSDSVAWVRVGQGRHDIQVQGARLTVPWSNLRNNGRGRLVLHWYWVDGTVTGSRYLAKALELRAKLFGRRQSAAAVHLAADFWEDPAAALGVLEDFLRAEPDFQPVFEDALSTR